MRNLLSRPISKIEYVIHGFLILLTTGTWLLILLVRIFYSRKLTTSNSGFSKDQIMAKIERINSSQAQSTRTINYKKRIFATQSDSEDHDWYEFAEPFSFEIVGESHKRNNLLLIIESYNAFQLGELEIDALLVLDSDNKFDPTAVEVMIEDKSVGFVSSDLSLDVTSYMDEKDAAAMKVRAKIGWDKSNPDPKIGVRLDFNF